MPAPGQEGRREAAPTPVEDECCDLLVAGSGAGGLSTAVVARKLGLQVVVVEKEAVFGGTTALSGGALWVPGHAVGGTTADSRGAAERYLRGEAGEHFDPEAVATFLDNAPRMVEWFERNTAVRFMPSQLPDYYPEAPGGAAVGRSIMAQPFDSRLLGAELARLRPPLRTITFLGMMFNSSNEDLKHFFKVTRSWRSFAYVSRRLLKHLVELARHGRAVQVTTGNALVARLARSTFDLGMPIRTATPLRELWIEHGRVLGAVVEQDGTLRRIRARRGVVLACGGFPQDPQRRAAHYPHVARGAVHLSPAPPGNTGDGLRLAEGVGAALEAGYPHAAAWIPVSQVPLGGAASGVFPHLQDRYKPGMIAVDATGRRFCNEALSYHDMGAAMIDATLRGGSGEAWLLCDHRTLRRYGLGFAKPAPVPLGPHLRSGYLRSGRTVAELAQAIGVPQQALQQTLEDYNAGARQGRDPAFDRGGSAFGRYLGDPAHSPNPCVAPLAQAPFYAVRLVLGDLGTFHGLRTTAEGRVCSARGAPIPGLWAVSNDRASVMGGAYPGGGITLGPAMTFGFVTANAIAAQAPEDALPAHPPAAPEESLSA